MPFNGSSTPNPAEPRSARAVRLLDCLIAFFDGGRNWCQHTHARKGRRCLSQAMQDIRQRERLTGDGARSYIMRALRESGSPYRVLIDFNDRCRGYGEMERILRRARDLASAAPAMERPHDYCISTSSICN